MKNKKAYLEWERRCKWELEFLFSARGQELQHCLVAQGYENSLFMRLMVLFGSGFTALELINKLKEEQKNDR